MFLSVAVKAKKNQAKIAVVGFSIVAVLALVLTVAGLQPFAYIDWWLFSFRLFGS